MIINNTPSHSLLRFPLLHSPSPPPPREAALSCWAACSCYFTSWAPVRVRAFVSGTSSQRVFGWVSFSSPGPVLLSIIPLSRRVSPLIPPCPIFDSAGLRTHSDRRPHLSPLEWEFPDFTLANCTSSAVSEQECNLFREYISSAAEAERSLTELCVPKYFSFSLKLGKTNREKEEFYSMCGCSRNLMCPIQPVVVGWLWFTFQWIPGPIFPFLCIPVMFRDN